MLYFFSGSTHTDLKVTGGAAAAWECWLESPQAGEELAVSTGCRALTPGLGLQALKAEPPRLPPGRGPPPGPPAGVSGPRANCPCSHAAGVGAEFADDEAPPTGSSQFFLPGEAAQPGSVGSPLPSEQL